MTKHFGDRILDFRARCNVSIRTMASALGIDSTGLSRIERGKTQPRRATKIRIEEFMRKFKKAGKRE